MRQIKDVQKNVSQALNFEGLTLRSFSKENILFGIKLYPQDFDSEKKVLSSLAFIQTPI